MKRLLVSTLVFALGLVGCGRSTHVPPAGRNDYKPEFPGQLLYHGDSGEELNMQRSGKAVRALADADGSLVYYYPQASGCPLIQQEGSASYSACYVGDSVQLPQYPYSSLSYLSHIPSSNPYISTFVAYAYYLHSMDPSIAYVFRVLYGGSWKIVSGQTSSRYSSADFDYKVYATDRANLEVKAINPYTYASGSIAGSSSSQISVSRSVPIGAWKPDDGFIFVLRYQDVKPYSSGWQTCSPYYPSSGSGNGGGIWDTIFNGPNGCVIPRPWTSNLRIDGSVSAAPNCNTRAQNVVCTMPVATANLSIELESLLQTNYGESRSVSRAVVGSDIGIGIRSVSFTGNSR
ncbi:MAG: hypothetical protein HY537_18665 [Deltaproteobacteria bacterium]|nr:hypothetical protein [Deltaproteobacteria bacterium]